MLGNAQDDIAEEPMIEEVMVKGIRSSLKRAMDTKRDSQGVVDAITAEDIGDFPTHSQRLCNVLRVLPSIDSAVVNFCHGARRS